MKLKLNSKTILRYIFTSFVFAVLCVAALTASLITYLLERFVSGSIIIPTIIWMLILSIAFGTAITALMSKWILMPITRLGDAMNLVAKRNFSVRLNGRSKLRAINDIYDDFNLMAGELCATEMLQSDFVSNVSHEFKTPINAIEGYATLLQDPTQSDSERTECVEKILFNTKRLSELVSNILLLSKVENHSIPLETKEYRLDEQIRHCILALESKWTEKNIEFDVDLEHIMFCGNESLMQHVWTNLIDNAIKFDPYGGNIRIRLNQKPKNIVFEIEDNGCGIPAESQKYIYDKFYQGDRSHKGDGNGLGLSLVKRILDSCHGKIDVKSKPDCGTKFIVTLPRSKKI